jgi:hypothetical protein
MLDKLGVTGSSPVPPTSESPANAGLCRSGGLFVMGHGRVAIFHFVSVKQI